MRFSVVFFFFDLVLLSRGERKMLTDRKELLEDLEAMGRPDNSPGARRTKATHTRSCCRTAA